MRAEHNTMCVKDPAQLVNLHNFYTQGKLIVNVKAVQRGGDTRLLNYPFSVTAKDR